MVKRKRATKRRKRKKLTFEQEMKEARAFENKRRDVLQKYNNAMDKAHRARTRAPIIKYSKEAAKYDRMWHDLERKRPELARRTLRRIGWPGGYAKMSKSLLERLEKRKKKRRKK